MNHLNFSLLCIEFTDVTDISEKLLHVFVMLFRLGYFNIFVSYKKFEKYFLRKSFNTKNRVANECI